VKLSDLDPIDAQKIRIDRVNINRDISPSDVEADTTMLEIETILGEKVALNQKAKQKPNLAFQTIKTLDNELVNLDGVLENTMEEKRKLKQTLKDAKTDDEKVAAEEKIKQSDDKIDKITETKKIKEEEYQKAINAYINKKQAKSLENLQYPNIASEK
jgi:seryl-tRNA synthetase